MAAHSSILAGEIPWTEEPGGLQSRGVHKESDTTMRLRSSNNSTVGLQSLPELSNISQVKGALSSGETEVSFLANHLSKLTPRDPGW